jgi:glycosyltransferase involved in cell wall biosynthesis
MKQLLIPWVEDPDAHIAVNQYGTTPLFLNSAAKKNQWKKNGILKLLYISAYYPHKQPGLISEAVAQLNSRGIPCHLTLTMDLHHIRKTPGGEKDFILLSKGIKRGHVTMIGTVSYKTLPRIYSNHDLFIFPSISETFGHPLVEAMSMGIPIIAADTAIHREVCKSSAIYFSPLYPSELAQKIQHLNENETLRASLTKNGLKNVSRNFAWEDHVDRLLASFQETMKG